MTTGERRRGRRFQLSLSCQVSFLPAADEEIAGLTRDISRLGLCVRLKSSNRAAPGVGMLARVRVALPRGSQFPPKCLVCSAQVVRVEQAESGEPLVALEMRRVRFGAPCGRERPEADPLADMPSFGFLQ